jgi:L-aspartate oxidase
LVTVAELIVRCATMRTESRGLHFREDYPDHNDKDWLRDTVIAPEFDLVKA